MVVADICVCLLLPRACCVHWVTRHAVEIYDSLFSAFLLHWTIYRIAEAFTSSKHAPHIVLTGLVFPS